PDAVPVRIHALADYPSLIRDRDRTQLDLYLPDVGLVIDHLGEGRTRDAVRDLLDIEQIRPGCINGRAQLEARRDDHPLTLAEKNGRHLTVAGLERLLGRVYVRRR